VSQANPINPTTGEEYEGGNIDRLIQQAEARGYSSMQFAGFTQWLRAGRVVKKGEKSLRIKACGKFDKVDAKTGKVTKGSFSKSASVFALEQTEELK
jgi:antirestriction protein ArdC